MRHFNKSVSLTPTPVIFYLPASKQAPAARSRRRVCGWEVDENALWYHFERRNATFQKKFGFGSDVCTVSMKSAFFKISLRRPPQPTQFWKSSGIRAARHHIFHGRPEIEKGHFSSSNRSGWMVLEELSFRVRISTLTQKESSTKSAQSEM